MVGGNVVIFVGGNVVIFVVMFGLQNPHVTKQSILNCSHLFLSFFFSQKSSDSLSATTPSHSYEKVFRKVAGLDTVIQKMDTLSLFSN